MKIANIPRLVMSLVWIINGLLCKVLNFTPRHEQIIGTIRTFGRSRKLTVLIGILEICMAIWILSGYKRRVNAIVQITVIGSMNLLEFFLVPDLLLWGRMNAVFALIFISVIFFNEFFLRKHPYFNQ